MKGATYTILLFLCVCVLCFGFMLLSCPPVRVLGQSPAVKGCTSRLLFCLLFFPPCLKGMMVKSDLDENEFYSVAGAALRMKDS